MRTKKTLTIVFLLFLLALGRSAALALDLDKGTIEGKMINKTTGKTVPYQEVTLHKYLNQREIGKESTKTDGEGKFRFGNLSTGPNYVYNLYSKYREVEYWSRIIAFKGKTTVEDVRLVVYESTSNPKDIKVRLHHIIFDIQGKLLLVKEIFLFYNEGERTYIGKKKAGEEKRITLNFSLPEGFANLRYPQGQGLMPCCVIPTERGFLDTMPVKPGLREVVFTYQLRYDSSKYLFRRLMDYDTDSLDVLLPAGGVKVSGQNLSLSPKTVNIRGKNYLDLKSQGKVRAGTLLSLGLSNLPAGQGFFKVVAYSLIAALILIGFAYPLFRKGKAAEGEKGTIKDSRETLLSAIAQLDDRFRAGKIPEKDYRALRKQKKERLMELYKSGKKVEKK
jgi:hypothetical protein